MHNRKSNSYAKSSANTELKTSRQAINMAWLILICSLILAAIDYRIAKRVIGSKNRRALKYTVSILLSLDFIPQIFTVITFILFRDNPTWLIMVGNWLLLTYFILAVARAPFNIVFLASQNRLARLLGATIGLAIVIVLLYGTISTRTDYTINRITIESEKIPESFSGYTIVQLSDLHVGTMVNPEKEISDIAATCNAANPDIIAMCGDLVNIRYEELTPSIKNALKKFSAKDGIYSITGNHDVGVYIKDSLTYTPDNNTHQLILQQETLGWRVLDNESEKIYRAEDSIYITGISYSKELQDHRHSRHLPETDFASAYDGVDTNSFSITLSHIPQLWDKILQESSSDLTLAGHVHSMQIKFPIGERGISPAMILYKRWSGLYEEQGRCLYINDGIGCVGFPMRIGAKPEITIFELRPKSPNSN